MCRLTIAITILTLAVAYAEAGQRIHDRQGRLQAHIVGDNGRRTIYTPEFKRIGTIRPQGKGQALYDAKGKYKGRILGDRVYDSKAKLKARIQDTGKGLEIYGPAWQKIGESATH